MSTYFWLAIVTMSGLTLKSLTLSTVIYHVLGSLGLNFLPLMKVENSASAYNKWDQYFKLSGTRIENAEQKVVA